MTAPGDPLFVGEGTSRYRAALKTYENQGFIELESQIVSAMVNATPNETKWVWQAAHGKHTVRGSVATIESRSEHGVTAVFEVHYIASNDRRVPTHLTFGSFDEKDIDAMTRLNGGTRVKRRIL